MSRKGLASAENYSRFIYLFKFNYKGKNGHLERKERPSMRGKTDDLKEKKPTGPGGKELSWKERLSNRVNKKSSEGKSDHLASLPPTFLPNARKERRQTKEAQPS